MSSADLFEDGFPHGTKEGFDKGCRGHGSCPGVLDFGRSCSQASMSYAGDYTYKKRVDGGLSPARIAELERLDGVKPAKSPTKTTEISQATVTVADSVEPLGDLAEPEPIDDRAVLDTLSTAMSQGPAEAGGIPLEKHGTTAGYFAGCRMRDECPAKKTTGVSCANAVAAKQREAKARKAAESGAVRPQEAVQVPVEAEPAESEIVSEAVAELVVEAVPAESGTRVRAEGLLTELADAKEQIERLRTQRDEARQWGAGMESNSTMLSGFLEEARAELVRVTEERDGLEKQVAEMHHHFDIQEQRLRAKAEAEVVAEASLVATTAAAVPAHGASLQVRQMGDAFAFDISGGGEAVRLELAFEAGQLQRAAVTTGN